MLRNFLLLFACLLAFGTKAQDRYIQSGDRLYDKLDFLGALEKYQISYIYQEDYYACNRIAKAYFAMQRFAEAEKWHKKTLSFKEAQYTDHIAYLKSLVALGKDSVALDLVEQLEPKFPNGELLTKLKYFLRFKLDDRLSSVRGRDMNTAYCIALLTNDNPEDVGPDVTYEWRFDDGTTVKGREAKHCFKESGEHSVRLISTDNTFGVLTKQDTLFPLYFLESTNFDLEGLRWVDAAVKLDARKLIYKKGVYGVIWQTGDGNVFTDETFLHKYLKKGNYTITLTILAIDDTKNIFPASSITRSWNVIER